MAQNVFEDFDEKFQVEINQLEHTLGKGGAADYSEYRDMVGRIRGLRTAQNVAKDLQRKYMDDSDE